MWWLFHVFKILLDVITCLQCFNTRCLTKCRSNKKMNCNVQIQMCLDDFDINVIFLPTLCTIYHFNCLHCHMLHSLIKIHIKMCNILQFKMWLLKFTCNMFVKDKGNTIVGNQNKYMCKTNVLNNMRLWVCTWVPSC
jgi:hypothetical protein